MTPQAEDVLISRIIDREADLADWQALEHWALESPSVWARLAHDLRNDQLLRAALGIESRSAVELPVRVRSRRRRALRRIAAAALWVGFLLAAFWLGRSLDSMPTDGGVPSEPLAMEAPAEGAASRGLGGFELIERLPDVVLKHEPSAEGLDVLCLRRTIERCRADNVYQLGRDELGRLAATPVRVNEGSASF